MTRLSKAASLAVGAALVSQAARASFTANDLYLGFNTGTAASDYIIDLGQPSVVGVGGSSVVDLSGEVSASLFASAFGANPAGVNMGVVGGQDQFPSSYDLFATGLRVGGAGNAAVPGSNLGGFLHSQSIISSAEVAIAGNPFPAAGNGLLDSSKSWSVNITALSVGSFYGASGINPSSAIDNTGTIYEDLWKATPSGAYSYLGYFTLSLSGPAPSLTFTPSAVPEPTAISMIAGGVALLLSFRNRFVRKDA